MAKKTTVWDELRAVINRCCAIAEASDKVSMQAMRKSERIQRDLANFKRETRSRFKSISILLERTR